MHIIIVIIVSSVSVFIQRTHIRPSDAIGGATRGPVLLVHVMAEVKCLEIRFKKKQVMCCTDICHVAARSKVVAQTQKSDKD